MAIVISGTTSPYLYIENPTKFFSKLKKLEELSLETKGLLAISNGVSGTYARLGWSDEEGHAFGIRNFRPICKFLQQHPFDSQNTLDDTLKCASYATYLIVSPSLSKKLEYVPHWLGPYGDRNILKQRWNKYIDDVNSLLVRNFRCVDNDKIKICKNKRQ